MVAVGLYQGDLVVAPSLTGRMRGRIAIDDTDFKQGVAYLFELRNKQRAEYEKRQAELAQSQKSGDDQAETKKNKEEIRFLMIYPYLAILVMGNSVFAKNVAKRD